MTYENFESLAVGLGAIITAFFSFLIWRANIKSAEAAKGAADAATESTRLSEMIFNMQEEQKMNVKEQLQRDFLKQCNRIRKVLMKIKERSDKDPLPSEIMKDLPESLHLSNYDLANYFDENERVLIYYTMAQYKDYKNKNFKEGSPSFNSLEELQGDNKQLLDRLDKIILEFTEIVS